MKNKLYLFFALLISFNCFAYGPIDFELINSKPGWKVLSNNEVYIQEIDLRSRNLVIITGEKQNKDPWAFSKLDLKTKFAQLSKSGALSLSNGSFFDNTEKVYSTHAGISYPFKNQYFKEHGWSTDKDMKNLKVFAWGIFPPFTQKSARVVDYYDGFEDDYFYQASNYITGKINTFNQDGAMNNKDYRTFIGVKNNHLVYILNGKNLTQSDATYYLKMCGLYESDIVMLDGGGSTQLSFINKNNTISNIFSYFYSNDRNIPQLLAVY